MIGKLKKSHVDGMTSQLNSLFHRSSCLSPELEKSALVFDESEIRSGQVVYPYTDHGQPDLRPRSKVDRCVELEVPSVGSDLGEGDFNYSFLSSKTSEKSLTRVGSRSSQYS